MKTFLTVLLFIVSWLIPMFLLPPSYSLAYGLLYGVSWIVFVIVMAAREREREERRFKEECERRRRQAYYSKRGYIIRVY